MQLRCNVKYCGGCQANYNRVGFVEKIQEACPTIEFVRHQGQEAEALLLVCGCSSWCVSDSPCAGDPLRIMVSGPQDYDMALQKLQDLCNANGN